MFEKMSKKEEKHYSVENFSIKLVVDVASTLQNIRGQQFCNWLLFFIFIFVKDISYVCL